MKSVHFTHQQEEEKAQNQSPASDINQPILAYAVGQSEGHAVDRVRPGSNT